MTTSFTVWSVILGGLFIATAIGTYYKMKELRDQKKTSVID